MSVPLDCPLNSTDFTRSRRRRPPENIEAKPPEPSKTEMPDENRSFYSAVRQAQPGRGHQEDQAARNSGGGVGDGELSRRPAREARLAELAGEAQGVPSEARRPGHQHQRPELPRQSAPPQ